MRTLKVVTNLLAAGLVVISLQGCTQPDPGIARDESLTLLQDAVRAGDAEALCSALVDVFSQPCAEQVLNSAGLAEAEFNSFSFSETEQVHTIAAAGFELAVRTSLIEGDEGEEWFFSLENMQLPEYSLPTAGVVNGINLPPEQRRQAMPSDTAPMVSLEPTDANVEINLIPRPWTNKLNFQSRWSPEAEKFLQREALNLCESQMSRVSFKNLTFGFMDTFLSDTRAKFPRLPQDQYVLTVFQDGSEFEDKSRRIVSPSEWQREPCQLGQTSESAGSMIVTWTALVSFDGSVGEITGVGGWLPYYNGVMLERTFETSFSGQVELNLDRDSYLSTLKASQDATPKLPLKVISN